MKRLATSLLATAALLLTSLPTHAQDSRLNLGLAWTMLDLRGEPVSAADFRPGPRLTVQVERHIPFSERFGLRIGTRFAQAGGRLEVESLGSGALEIDYLEMTALGEAKFSLVEDRVALYLQTGPVLASELTCRLTDKSGSWASGSGNRNGCYEEIGLKPAPSGLAWAAGTRLEFKLFGKLTFSVGIRYNHSLMGRPHWTLIG